MKNELVTSKEKHTIASRRLYPHFKVGPHQKQKIFDIGYLGAIQNIHDGA